LLGTEPLAIGDFILTEVLRGFRQDSDYQTAKRLLTTLTVYDMLGTELAVKSADNYRTLRKRGITVRKTADIIIATFCIEHGHALLFDDRDFVPFVEYLGLRAVR
jgi:predicted nucleic acid-binding protein